MKPSLPQGTRDFPADVVHKRNFIINTIKATFQLYGFQPLETPAMENLDTLQGKYGEEGDKLIFKILNNGLDNPAKHQQAQEAFDKVLQGKSVKDITERALRYDLTIPFARFVAMNHAQLTMPYKRYQVQPVWRADRPQKGRYREFYQCDADVVGSKSLLNEVEFTHLYSQVFSSLQVPVEIRINSRKLLAALAELCGGANEMVNITIAIDKLDKIGLEKVKQELGSRGLTEAHVQTIEKYLLLNGTKHEKLQQLKSLFGDNETAAKGIAEIEFVLRYCTPQLAQQVVVDLTLARGLNYYTGIIFEVKAQQVQIGSIGGGGRYDDLTGLFGVPNMPGVGISFGVDRIYDVMKELNLFPAEVKAGTQVVFFNLGIKEAQRAFELVQQVRTRNISCELYHENAKFDRQFKYAEKKGAKYAVILGSKELEDGNVVVKNLESGEQLTLPQSQLMNYSF